MLSSEAVAGGHPDKVADQISDAILDAYLRHDRNSRVACETLWSGKTLVIGGEITSSVALDHKEIAARVLADYGYKATTLVNAVSKQSPEIAEGVFGEELGAGDQGIMFGYANAVTRTGLWFPHEVALALVEDFTAGTVDGFKPDAKSQVTVNVNGEVDTVVLSAAHSPALSLDEVRDRLHNHVLDVLDGLPQAEGLTLHLNPAGSWTISGGIADAGLTGRKIIVDTYGGRIAHGGGAFSGKDPSKVDRSAAYMARALAKALTGIAGEPELMVQLGYAIGVAEPVSIAVCRPSGHELANLSEHVAKRVDLRPAAIIERLGLLDFNQYEQTAHGGHFGAREFPWEQVAGLESDL